MFAFSVLSAAGLQAWPKSSASKKKGDSSPLGEQKRSARFFLSGDFLYWRPDQGGMVYCLTTDEIVSLPFGLENKQQHQESRWGPGFRAGAGFIFPPSALDMSAYWTSFHHQASGSTSKSAIIGTQIFAPNDAFPVGGSAFGAGGAHSRWDLLFDVVELDFGYSARFKDRFVLRPYVGAAGARVDQKQTIKYKRFLDLNSSEFVTATIEQKNDFRGAGPKLGIDGDFCMGWGFGIMGNLSAALFYGWANNPVRFHFNGDSANYTMPSFEIKYDQHKLIPAAAAQAGLSWEKNFGRYFSIFLSASYEVQYFWGTWRNQSSAVQNLYISDAGFSNLMLQGWTGRIKLTF